MGFIGLIVDENRESRMLRRTLQIFGVAFLFGLVLTMAAHAGVNLKRVQVTDGSQVDLIFDQKITGDQVRIEYLRDIIQLSLTNVSVYPAKVSTVSGSELSKVFAYQYSPSLVRCRLTVKGDSVQYQDRVQMKISGKTVTLRIAPSKADRIATAAASTARVAAEKAAEAEVAEKAAAKAALAKSQLNSEEKQLLDRVMKSDDSKAEKSAKADKAEKNSKNAKNAKNEKLAGGKSLPTPMKSIGIMLFTIGLLGVFLMFLKKVKGQKLFKSDSKGLSKFLGKLTGGVSRGMIEVVATHHLAPKKSIVMVRIQGRMLVLGMTNDGVNLITEFKANEEEAESDESMNVRAFAEGLKKFERDGTVGMTTPEAQAPQASFAGILTRAFGQVAARTEQLDPRPQSQSQSRPAEPRLSARSPAAAAPVKGQAPPKALNAYSSQGRGGFGAQAAGEPSFAESPSLAAALNGSSTKTSLRAQVRSKVEGLKNL